MKRGRVSKSKSARPAATLARAEFLLQSGDASAAIRCATSLLRKDREHVGALEVLARALWQAGKLDELLVNLSTLIRLNPYEPGYHALRGATYQSLGRPGEAIKAFARAGSAATSSASITELREWQASLVASLLQEDPVFKAHYAQDPEAACRQRGFEFMPELKTGETWFSKPAAQAAAQVRPS